MFSINHRINGLAALYDKLDKAKYLERKMARPMKRWAQQTIDNKLAGRSQYPSPPPGSRYTRTGRLGKSWGHTQPTLSGRVVKMSIYNRTPYAIYVHGDSKGQRQAWMHKGRWWKAVYRIRRERPKLTKMAEKVIERLWSEAS